MIVFGLTMFALSLMYLVACWRISPSLTLMTFIPIVGIIPAIQLLITGWHELKGLILAQFVVGFLFFGSSFLAIAGLDLPQGQGSGQDLAAYQRQQQQQRIEMMQRDFDRERQRRDQYRTRPNISMPRYNSPFGNNNHNNDYTPEPPPPPPPPNPVFKPGDLPAGQSSPSGSPEAWAAFEAPDVGLSETKRIDMHGYTLAIPADYEVADVRPIARGNGTQWRIVDGQASGGAASVDLAFRVIPVAHSIEGQVYAPTWTELLGQSSVTRDQYAVQYGTIGDVPFARCADEQVALGHATGSVRYLSMPIADQPQRIEISFKTDPNEYGPSFALMCEAIARSMRRSHREMLPMPQNLDAIPKTLSGRTPLDRPGAGEPEPSVRGPFVFSLDSSARGTFDSWSQRGDAWQTQARLGSSGDASIRVAMQPVLFVPIDGIPAVAASGPRRTDHVICAFGGDASYVRLWNDAVFVRLEHAPQPSSDGGVSNKISYHGYLGQQRVDIELYKSNRSSISMNQLEHAIQNTRLATPPEMLEAARQSGWLKEILAEDQPSFTIANGVDAKEALLLDKFGRVTLSPQYDPETMQLFTVYPEIGEDDQRLLADYKQWTSDPKLEEHLGKAERKDGFSIRPIAELNPDHEGRQLAWQTRTKAGTVGMTIHVDPLRTADRELLTPIRTASNGRIQICMGRKTLRPSQTPDITYRDVKNIRIWRINVPPSARQEIARCHYVALLPEDAIVISTSYHANRPEQLAAFDASVATLVYQDGKALKRSPETAAAN
jgi:hypothetical protein